VNLNEGEVEEQCLVTIKIALENLEDYGGH
jgi:hypothetical protein